MSNEEQREFLQRSGLKNPIAQLKSSIAMKEWLKMIEKRVASPKEELKFIDDLIKTLDFEVLQNVRNLRCK